MNINTEHNSMKLGRLSGKQKNWWFNRLSSDDRLNDQLQKQHNFISQTFCEFYENNRADTDAKTNMNDTSQRIW